MNKVYRTGPKIKNNRNRKKLRKLRNKKRPSTLWGSKSLNTLKIFLIAESRYMMYILSMKTVSIFSLLRKT